MSTLSDSHFHPAVLAILAPLIGSASFSGPEEDMVWMEQGRVRMELEHIGEGNEGDYDVDDDDDTPLLRFSFYVRNHDDPCWISLSDTSYCTAIDARSPWEVRLACAAVLFQEVGPALKPGLDEVVDSNWGRRAKNTCEQMSWNSADEFETLVVALRQRDLDQALPHSATASRAPRI